MSNNQVTLSPADYAKATSLQALLSKAVNDCYLTQSPCPAATMSNLLRATYTLDTFSDITITEVCDGDGSGFTAEVTAHLTSGASASTVVSHSNNTVPFHPNTSGRRIALLPIDLLTATGPNSLQMILSPPPPPPAVTKKGTGAAEGANKGQALGSASGLGEVDTQQLATATALAKATRFRLTKSIDFFNKHVKQSVIPLRAVSQHSIDRALLMGDPRGPFEHLLGQVAAGISLACAKVAASAVNKPLALYVGSLYQGICGRELSSDASAGAGQGWLNSTASSPHRAPPSLNSTAAHMSSIGGSSLPFGLGATPTANTNASGNANGALGVVGSPNMYAIPNIIVTVFSTDPRGMGKTRVREVCLVVHVQNNDAGGAFEGPSASGQRHTNNRLTMDTVSTMHAIIELAMSKAAAIAAQQCGATVAEVESTMMPVMPDGSVKFPFFESPAQMVEVMEQSIREVTAAATGGSVGAAIPSGAAGGNTSPLGSTLAASSYNAANGPLREFSVGLVVDGGLCYRPHTAKYALVNGEAELSGAVLSEQLAAMVNGVAVTANSGAAAAASPNATVSAAALAGTGAVHATSSSLGTSAVIGSGSALTYLEDTHLDTDIEAMQRLAYRVGTSNSHTIIAGCHLYGSDATALSQGAQLMLTNNALLRLNDVGRLSTLLENARLFRNSYNGASVGVIGEAMEGDGAALAHIAIGIHARTIRVGGMLRKEHAVTINELLRMTEYLDRCGLIAKTAPRYDYRRMALPKAPVEIVTEVVAAPTKKGRK